MMINEISFVHPDVSEKDRELFGFDDGDEHTIGHAVNSTTGDWMMCHLMHFLYQLHVMIVRMTIIIMRMLMEI